ncbi:MAG: hypothetical protein Q8P41_00110 [Pseudomonadota bacterium]|nr:hypothetical protein [Pseudomonadota bacterium]
MDALVETVLRGWEGFAARPSGPLSLRFLIQPAIASLLAIRAGLADARAGRPAFLWAAATDRAHRGALLLDAARDLRTPLIVATVLDVAYQIVVHRGVYVVELAFTVALLAFVPYVLVRGPTNRVASAVGRDHHA